MVRGKILITGKTAVLAPGYRQTACSAYELYDRMYAILVLLRPVLFERVYGGLAEMKKRTGHYLKTRRLCSVVIVVLCTVFFTQTVRAADHWDMKEIKKLTEKKLNGQYTTDEENKWVSTPDIVNRCPEYEDGYIMVGDSRQVYMDLFLGINNTYDNWFSVGCSGQGLSYLQQVGIPTAMRVEKGHPEIKRWHYIVTIGVNDMENTKRYKAYLKNLAEIKDMYFVSVNPVMESENSLLVGYSNERIRNFNREMSGIPGVKYINTYSSLMRNGYTTGPDGLHYTADTSEYIFSLIKEGVSGRVKINNTSVNRINHE